MPTGGGFTSIALIVIAVLALAQAFFIVAPDEQGLVKRFGDVVRTVEPGPHLKIPFLETVVTPKVEKLHRVEVGFRTDARGRTRSVPRESLMLTGDMNILSVEFIVQYKIKEARDYLYNITNVENHHSQLGGSGHARSHREESKIDEALTVGKAEIQQSTQVLLQGILDQYQAGVQIATVQLQDVNPPEAVAAAFKDVASAKEDREKLINQAHGYRNDLLPRAKGEAAQQVNTSPRHTLRRALPKQRVKPITFSKLLKNTSKLKTSSVNASISKPWNKFFLTRKKIILDSSAGKNVLPYLPLDRLRKTSEAL